MSAIGIVAVGRNEGERFRRCLESVAGRGTTVVYVDSASTDGSVDLARARGAEVVELDLSIPFTVARARRAGFERLREIAPEVELVQFVDGDCEVVDGWLDTARSTLEARPDVAVVFGRRRERYREQSLYNRLADIEWDSPVGEVDACGGDAMMRVGPVVEAGGYNPSVIVGEEADLCLRLRRLGWKILRVDVEMTLHDLAVTRFGQWWKRSIRTGYGYAEGSANHGRSADRHWIAPARGVVVWGLLVPSLALGLAWPTRGLSLLLVLLYPLLYLKILRGIGWRKLPPRDARLYALACVVGKFPQAIGFCRYWVRRQIGKQGGLIEYKEMPRVRTTEAAP